MDSSHCLYGRELDFKDRGFKIFNFKTVQVYPYDCIGAIYFQNRYGEMGIGTGFLIGPDLVLTSARNIFSREAGEHQNMRFYPGVSGDFEDRPVYNIVNYRIPSQFGECEEGGKHYYDYALLKLDQQIEKEAYLELALNYSDQNQELGISGYRRDAHS